VLPDAERRDDYFAARGWSARTPLRVKLVLAVLALSAIVLLVVGLAATAALRNYLAAQDDERLQSTLEQVVRQIDRPGPAVGTVFVPSGAFSDLLNAAGESISDENNTIGDSVPDLPVLDAAEVRRRAGEPFTVGSVDGIGGDWRVAAQAISGNRSVVVAIDLTETHRTVERLIVLELVLGGVSLVLLAVVASYVIRRSLRPLEGIGAIAEGIAAGDLTRRVPDLDQRTEIGRLGASLNGMLARIESAVRERQDAAAQAQTSEQRMRTFVADASHELRTPLTSIRGFAELYRQGAVREPDEVPRVMERIESEARRMNVLVEDMLLLARMDERRPMTMRPVDLLPLATDAVYDARAVAPDRDIRVVPGPGLGPDEPGAIVQGDEVRLRQVIGNLLSNALVHTPAGSPVEVHVGNDFGPPGRRVVVAVADHGPGISPDHAARVFERFYRTDAARSRVHGGSGLGLAIVAAIVDAHGGTVDILTTPGGGATFVVRLAGVDPE
jgi:two-component system OmpR family sensor kinase